MNQKLSDKDAETIAREVCKPTIPNSTFASGVDSIDRRLITMSRDAIAQLVAPTSLQPFS